MEFRAFNTPRRNAIITVMMVFQFHSQAVAAGWGGMWVDCYSNFCYVTLLRICMFFKLPFPLVAPGGLRWLATKHLSGWFYDRLLCVNREKSPLKVVESRVGDWETERKANYHPQFAAVSFFVRRVVIPSQNSINSRQQGGSFFILDKTFLSSTRYPTTTTATGISLVIQMRCYCRQHLVTWIWFVQKER